MKAIIITIGDEILLGQIMDTNSVWLSQQLATLGIDLIRSATVSDKESEIIKSLDNTLPDADLILITGGLGPTKDDITKKTLAEYFKLDMVFDQDLFLTISNYFKKMGLPLTEMVRQQCYMPTNIQKLKNGMGTAPGMLFKHQDKWIVSMPGVPYEMKWIFENSLLSLLKEQYPEYGNIYFRTIHTVGMGESRIAELITDITDTLPKEISLAFLPSVGHVKLRLTSKEDKSFFTLVDEYVDKISERLKHLVYGYDNIRLEEALKRDFLEKGLTLSTAESCTGGYLAHRIVSASGASEYYMGTIVAYDYRLKTELLNVSNDLLDNYGAVSEECVLAMLDGLLQSTKSDLGVAISGIAGPGGGTVEKPVGTIWMAYGNSKNKKTKKLQLSKDRQKNIEYTTVAAMNSLRLFLTEL